MKKITLLTFTVILLGYNTRAQLTNAQVYNFNVGDIFETESCGNGCISSPPTYTWTKVLKKWYSVTADTLYYKDTVSTYTLPSCMSCNGTFSTYIDTLRVDSLSTLANGSFNFYFGNQCSVKDTLIDSGFCSRRTWRKYPDPNCTDTLYDNATTAWVIEGCGGGYFSAFDNSGPFSLDNNLVYYKKGTDSCGSLYVITGMDQLQATRPDINVFPNPSNSKFTITIKDYELKIGSRVEVYNMFGEKIYMSSFGGGVSHGLTEEDIIDLTGKPTGIYFYRVISETNNLVGEGKLIIE